MTKANGKGDVRTGAGRVHRGPGDEHNSPGEELHDAVGPARRLHALAVLEALEFLCLRDDGWLRCSPDVDSGLTYWKWKFTAGRFAGHYVMAVYPTYQVPEALDRLLHKLAAVEDGSIKPTKDNFFTDL